MLPRFYIAAYNRDQPAIVLDEDSSRHIVQVLRMKAGDLIQLTDGKGHLLEAAIMDGHKKKCLVEVRHSDFQQRTGRSLTLAISLLKNVNRFEWCLEKATEIGVARIFPLICERTEKRQLRLDRMQQILVSAMLQSQQTWLPELTPPMDLDQVIGTAGEVQKFIAHCAEGERVPLAKAVPAMAGDPSTLDHGIGSATTSSIMLIGPEGDFTVEEIAMALNRGFVPVTLGATRLRTETAGIVAAAFLCST